MRYSMIKVFAVVSVIAMAGTVSGCQQNDSPIEESSFVSLVSEQSIDPNSAEALVGQWQSENLPDYIYTFNSDSTGQYDMAGKILKLTYSVEDGRLTLNFLEDGYTPVTLEYLLEKDRLDIKDSFGKDTFYIKVKE